MRYRSGEISVHELRQNLSVYLRRVKAGETGGSKMSSVTTRFCLPPSRISPARSSTWL